MIHWRKRRKNEDRDGYSHGYGGVELPCKCKLPETEGEYDVQSDGVYKSNGTFLMGTFYKEGKEKPIQSKHWKGFDFSNLLANLIERNALPGGTYMVKVWW